MARAAAPERANPFLTRCNLQPSTPLHEVADPAVSRPESPSGSQPTNCWAPWLRRLPGSNTGTGLTRRCGSCGRLSSSSKPWWRVILGSGWRLMISMLPQRHLSRIRVLDQRSGMCGAGGCSERLTRDCGHGCFPLGPAKRLSPTDPQRRGAGLGLRRGLLWYGDGDPLAGQGIEDGEGHLWTSLTRTGCTMPHLRPACCAQKHTAAAFVNRSLTLS
jgi:hypothetical protein